MPFEGLRYNLAQVGNLSDVVAPPYDVISPEEQDELYAKHENNVVRLILNKKLPTDDAHNNRYTRSARVLKDWKESGVLIKDSKPSLYVYHQIFTVNGREYCRKGFMCGCEAVPFGEGMVFPHELTMSGPKQDRLMLTTTCKTNFSQIFGLYPDENNEVQNILEEAILGETPLEATDRNGVINRMWIVDDQDVVGKVVKLMGPKPIFIADGHHRYETACNYRKQIAQQGLLTTNHPANHVLMVCVAMEDPGLIVLPTHRLFPNVRAMSQADLRARTASGASFSSRTRAAKRWTKSPRTISRNGGRSASRFCIRWLSTRFWNSKDTKSRSTFTTSRKSPPRSKTNRKTIRSPRSLCPRPFSRSKTALWFANACPPRARISIRNSLPVLCLNLWNDYARGVRLG